MKKLSVFLATWFYSGLIPPILLKGMAGTYGSFFSLPFCYLLVVLLGTDIIFVWQTGIRSTMIQLCIYLGILAWVLFIGCLTVPVAERALGPQTDWHGRAKWRDQNQIVIDEIWGMLITCWPLIFFSFRSIWLSLGLAFLLFRFFDIIKVPPTRYFDNMKNEAGVMLDDGVAGIYAGIVLGALVRIFNV